MLKWIPIFAALLFLAGCSATGKEGPGYSQITMEEARQRLSIECGFIILDVRTPEEFAAGHIPGALNIPNETIGTDEIPQLPEKEQRIYVYCRSGNRSKQAAEKLVALGYTDIVEIGGILDWPGEVVTGRD
jgi:rhodanese-related sulfurtransferase